MAGARAGAASASDRPGPHRSADRGGGAGGGAGSSTRAIALHELAPAAAALGDRALQARALNNYGLVLESQGDYPRALACYQDALAINRDMGAVVNIANNLNNIGGAAYAQGAYQQALDVHGEALELRRRASVTNGGYRLADQSGRGAQWRRRRHAIRSAAARGPGALPHPRVLARLRRRAAESERPGQFPGGSAAGADTHRRGAGSGAPAGCLHDRVPAGKPGGHCPAGR